MVTKILITGMWYMHATPIQGLEVVSICKGVCVFPFSIKHGL